jgi:predicted exporter
VTGGQRAAGLFGLWVAALVLLLIHVVQTLRLGTDLRLFLPRPTTPGQELVLEGIGEGPASRLLLIALEGAEPAALAAASHALVDHLRGNAAFRLVENGASDAIPGWVTGHRYLLTPALDRRPLDATTLRQALTERLQDLASPAAPLLEPMIPSDPTLEVLAIAESWAPPWAPRTIGGAWFDRAGVRALLVAQTRAAGFDPDGQQRALAELDTAFEAVRGNSGLRMTVSGPGRFSALMKERTQQEAAWLGSVSSAGLLLLLYAAYRRPRVLALASLPLLSAALAGLAVVGLRFGEVHGITLAFGFTLIGVAQDYPIHLFSHQHRGLPPFENARRLWSTLATGVVATCVAYLAFLGSGVTGLAQLGWFTITGLLVAGLTTRYLLPGIIGENFRDPAQSPRLGRLEARLSLPGMPPALYAVTAAACLAVLTLMPGPFWEDDLGALTPVPRALLEQDADLRREIGAPDPRYLAVVTTDTMEQVLQKLEAATPGLAELVADGAIAGFDHVARYLPSAMRQRQRQRRLPSRAELADALTVVQRGLPFRAGTFDPFLADVARERESPPLTLAALRGTVQEALFDGLLHERGGRQAAIIAFSGVADATRLRDWVASAGNGMVLIDLKRESVALVVRQRDRILLCLAIAAVLLILVVRISLGDWRRAVRVLAPMALTTVAIMVVLRLAGQALDLFHLMSLVLAAGLGLDYALFFERAGMDRAERLRTLHGILVCALSTLMVFVALSFSSLPVLRSIGTTVSLGVLFSFLLALSLARQRPQQP